MRTKKLLILSLTLISLILMSCKEETPVENDSTLYKLNGIIIDEDNEPVENVIIELNGVLDTSNEQGEFKFNDLTAGVYPIKTKHIFYHAFVNNLEIKSDTNIILEIKKRDLQWYPQEIGNKWFYADTLYNYHYTTVIIGDTIMANNKKYFIREFMGSYKTYMRQTENEIFYLNENGEEFLYADFTRQIGEEFAWEYSNDSYRWISKKDTIWSDIFNVNLVKYTFQEFEYEFSICQGVGEYSAFTYGMNRVIKGAKINDDIYGEL